MNKKSLHYLGSIQNEFFAFTLGTSIIVWCTDDGDIYSVDHPSSMATIEGLKNTPPPKVLKITKDTIEAHKALNNPFVNAAIERVAKL